MIRTSVLWLVLLAVAFVLNRAWLAGELSTLSFTILGCVAAFEFGCLWFLFRGFSIWERDEERRVRNVVSPRKRFG